MQALQFTTIVFDVGLRWLQRVAFQIESLHHAKDFALKLDQNAAVVLVVHVVACAEKGDED